MGLHTLCVNGKSEGIDLLKKIMEQHPDWLNAKNKYGKTPIMECAYYSFLDKNEKGKQEREEIILFLLEQGAETHHKNEYNRDLLYWCKDSGLKNAENMLLKMQKVDEDEM